MALWLLFHAGMSPVKTNPEALDAFALELQEVEWFGRSVAEAAPVRVTRLGRLLGALGTLTAALLPVLGR